MIRAPHASASYVAESPPLSARIAKAIRASDAAELSALAPAAACIIPLLLGLGLGERREAVIESLPYRQDEFDLLDLRNTLAALGIDTSPHGCSGADIAAGILPCLLETEDGRLRLVLVRHMSGYVAYLPETNEYTADYALEPGTFYFLSDLRAVERVRSGGHASWISSLAARFSAPFLHVMIASLAVNVLAVLPPLFIMAVYDQAIGARHADTLPYLLGGLVTALGVEFGFRCVRSVSIARIASRIDFLVSIATYRQMLEVPPTSVERMDLWSRVAQLRQFDGVRDFLSGPNALALVEAPFVLVYVVTIGLIAGWLCLAPLAMLLVFILLGVLWSRTFSSTSTRAGHVRSRRNQMVFEAVYGTADIRFIGTERTRLQEIREASAEASRSKAEETRLNRTLTTIAAAGVSLTGVVTVGAGAHMVMQEQLTVGALIATMVLVWRVGAPARSMLVLAPRLRFIAAGIRQVDALMSAPSEARPSSAVHIRREHPGAISFRGVSLRYGVEENPALSGVTLDVSPGEIAVCAGYSGAGKSTLLKVIARMHRPQVGSVHIDGVDLRQIDPIRMRKIVTYIPHSPRVFHGTISENLRLGRSTATDDEILESARQAGVLDSIETLPDGFDTTLSPGTSQRLPGGFVYGLCLARAYVRSSPILLIDEPGAHLDAAAEHRLIEQLRARSGSQTIVIATHRPTYIALASRVFVLGGGRLLNE